MIGATPKRTITVSVTTSPGRLRCIVSARVLGNAEASTRYFSSISVRLTDGIELPSPNSPEGQTRMASARTRCPECDSVDVVDLADIVYSFRVDFFRCRACVCWWMVPKGKNGPATRVVFGDPKRSENKQAS